MKEDLNNFYSALQNGFASSASSVGGVIIAIAFLEAISIFFLLITVLRYAGDDKESNEAVNTNGINQDSPLRVK